VLCSTLPGLPTPERAGMLSNTAQVIDDLHRIMANLSSKQLLQMITASGSKRNKGNVWIAASLHELTGAVCEIGQQPLLSNAASYTKVRLGELVCPDFRGDEGRLWAVCANVSAYDWLDAAPHPRSASSPY